MRAPIYYALLPFLLGISISSTTLTGGGSLVICICLLVLIGVRLKKHKSEIIDKGEIIGLVLGCILNVYISIYNSSEKERCADSKLYEYLPARELNVGIKIKKVLSKQGFDSKRVTIYEGIIVEAPEIRGDLVSETISARIYKDNLLKIKMGDRINVLGVIKYNVHQVKAKGYITNTNSEYSIIQIQNIEISKKGKIANLRRRIENEILENNSISKECGAFIYAFILGNKSFLTEAQYNEFKAIGIMHLFAVSGLHIGIAFLVVKNLFKKFIVQQKFLFCISISILLLYVILVGSPISAIRSYIMIVFWQISFVFLRRSNSTSALGWAAIIILIVEPEQIYDIGFQLSFTVVLSILWVLGGYSGQRPGSILYFLSISFVVSYAAFCCSSLLVIDKFHYINPASILLNGLLMPFIFLLFVIFLIYLFSNFFYPMDWFSFFIGYIYTAIEQLVGLFDSFHLSQIYFNSNFDIPDSFHLMFACILIASRRLFERLWLKLLFLSCLPVCFIFLSLCFN
jgi:ComEC/Rec2-related protein